MAAVSVSEFGLKSSTPDHLASTPGKGEHSHILSSEISK